MKWVEALAGLALFVAGCVGGFALCWRVVAWKVRLAERLEAESVERIKGTIDELTSLRERLRSLKVRGES